MRICSLVPGATEALFALGLGDFVVGVTHECDFPPEAATRPVATASLVDTTTLASVEIDRLVSTAAAEARPLYAIDEDRWDEIGADLVVVQEVCDVCAVSRDDVHAVIAARALDVETVPFSPRTLPEVLASIVGLGVRFGAEAAADELTAGMRARLGRVRAALEGVESAPRVFVAEWLDPPFSAGHWVPDMVALAGGIDVAGTSGELSYRLRWGDVQRLEPDVVILAPCGFDLDRTLTEADPAALGDALAGTPAAAESRVFAVDANGCFSRPGPRLVDGVELLAFLLHPDAYPDPGVAWSRVRL
jgi:iron complex transport system substrate-binding protein